MNKTHMTNWCKDLLKKEKGYILDDFELAIIKLLLNKHPDKDKKIGCGVENIFIGKGLYGSSCFWIKRTDGTETDFSYRSCINAPTQNLQFSRACREAAQHDIDNYLDDKSDGIYFICEITGEKLQKQDVHVDHYGEYKFSDIVKRFIKEFNINVDETKFNETENGCMHTNFLNSELSDKFRAFHNKYAKLRIIKKEVHKEITHAKSN